MAMAFLMNKSNEEQINNRGENGDGNITIKGNFKLWRPNTKFRPSKLLGSIPCF